MFEDIINKVLASHDDFNYYEIEELCQDFYDEIPVKIKEETKLKRVNKYISSEFELDGASSKNKNADYLQSTKYSLETIPKYLFE
jgi:hypothetical protein